MKKPLFHVLTLFFLVLHLHAQVSFQKYYGTDSKEFEQVQAAVTTPEGGILVAGITESGEHGAYDFFLQKLRPDGTESWIRTYGAAGMDYLSAVAPAAGGGYLISGYAVGAIDSTFDAILAKVDEEGTLLWWKTYGNGSTELGKGVCQRTDQSIMLSGTAVGYSPGAPDFYPIVFQVEYDPNGNFVAYHEVPANTQPTSIKTIATPDNGYLSHTDDDNSSGDNARLLKYGSNHELEWEKTPAEILAQMGLADGKIFEVQSGASQLVLVVNTGEGMYTAALGLADGDVVWFKKTAPPSVHAGVQVLPNEEIRVAIISDSVYVKRFSPSGTLLDSVTTAAPPSYYRPVFCFYGSDLYLVQNFTFNLQHDYGVTQIDLGAQTSSWQQNFGEQGVPDQEYGWTITGTSDGGFVVAGTTQEENGTPKIWLLKADEQGNVVWETTHVLSNGLNDFYMVLSVETDNQGNIVLFATTAIFDPAYHLLKFSPAGNLIFDKLVKQALFYYPAHAVPLPSGGYVVSMFLLSDFSQPRQPAILRLDENGNQLWEKIYPGDIYNIEVIPDEGFVVAGGKFLNNVSYPWVLKTDLDGNTLWEHVYVGIPNASLESIVRSANGQLLAGGYVIYPDEKTMKALVVKLEDSGNETWQAEYSKGGFTYWQAINLLPEPDGGACLFSRFALHPNPGEFHGTYQFGTRLSLARIDSAGVMTAEQIFGSDGSYPEAYKAARTTDGDVVMCSTVRAVTAQQDAWVVKADCSASVAVTEQTSANSLTLTPNPVGADGAMYLTLDAKTGNTVSVSCFDAAGKSIWQKTVPVHAGENRISLNAPRLPGAYSVVVSDARGVIKTGQIIVH